MTLDERIDQLSFRLPENPITRYYKPDETERQQIKQLIREVLDEVRPTPKRIGDPMMRGTTLTAFNDAIAQFDRKAKELLGE